MVKYTYIFLFVLVLFSCASQKKTEKHTLDSYSQESIENMNKRLINNLSEFDWSILLEFEDLEINIKRYDTQAKPDSLGNYPLKEEETRKSKKKTQKEEQKQKEEQLKIMRNINHRFQKITILKQLKILKALQI